MAAAGPRCPICRREGLPRAQNPSFPFCSPRCRSVDLGKWLGEEYRICDRTPDEDDDGPPALPGDGHTEDPN
jgi:endogenous inhibitor of DNA gyrase (YacG/DUF329 family)